EPVYGYVIYRFNDQDTIDLNNPKYILHIQYDASISFDDQATEKGKTYLYVITAIDRLKNESDRSPAIAVTTK
ncbi:MAG: glycoside hydrolase, partial [Mucilaginibacter sp.]